MTGPVYADQYAQRIRQTDYRFSDITAWDERARKMRPAINQWGCLFFSLCSIAEDHGGVTLSVSDKRQLYRLLTRMQGGNEYRGMGPTCFVRNHEDVLNQALEAVGSNDRARYVFIDRGDGELVHPYPHSEQYVGRVNAKVEQWAVRDSFSHFIHVGLGGLVVYDPYPGLPLIRLESTRGYYVGAA